MSGSESQVRPRQRCRHKKIPAVETFNGKEVFLRRVKERRRAATVALWKLDILTVAECSFAKSKTAHLGLFDVCLSALLAWDHC